MHSPEALSFLCQSFLMCCGRLGFGMHVLSPLLLWRQVLLAGFREGEEEAEVGLVAVSQHIVFTFRLSARVPPNPPGIGGGGGGGGGGAGILASSRGVFKLFFPSRLVQSSVWWGSLLVNVRIWQRRQLGGFGYGYARERWHM